MIEQLHPGVHRHETTFSDFESFINTGNASPDIKERFRDFLFHLYDQTKQEWAPGHCHAVEWMEEMAKEMIDEEGFTGVRIEPRSWAGDGHFWLVVRFSGYGRQLIIDPTGVPTVGENYYERPETIIPFFGDKDFSPPHSKRIYEAGKPLENGVYHIFHP